MRVISGQKLQNCWKEAICTVASLAYNYPIRILHFLLFSRLQLGQLLFKPHCSFKIFKIIQEKLLEFWQLSSKDVIVHICDCLAFTLDYAMMQKKKQQPKILKDHDKGCCTWAEEKQRKQQKLKTKQIKIHCALQLFFIQKQKTIVANFIGRLNCYTVITRYSNRYLGRKYQLIFVSSSVLISMTSTNFSRHVWRLHERNKSQGLITKPAPYLCQFHC